MILLKNKSAYSLFLISSKKIYPAVSFLSKADFSLVVMFLREFLGKKMESSISNRASYKTELNSLCKLGKFNFMTVQKTVLQLLVWAFKPERFLNV